MYKFAIVLASAALVSACATRPRTPQAKPEPKASTEDVAVAEKALRECHFKVLPKLDDRISDAGTVARAVATSCDDEGETVFQLLAQGEPWRFYNDMRKAWPAAERERALQSVLLYRAKIVNSSPHQTLRQQQDI